MDMRAPGLRRKSLADVAERLRSVVRYLHRTGRIPTDLTPHIIGPMLYAYEDVPSTLDTEQIAAVLAATKRTDRREGCAIMRYFSCLPHMACAKARSAAFGSRT
jgi:site-specific recombinase XerC